MADGLACAAGVGLALTDGLLRIAAGEHWATDVLASGAIALVAGYVVPYLLHFAPPGDGRLDGSLSLSASTGPIRAGDETRFAIGLDAQARQWWWWNGRKSIGLELGGGALLAGTHDGFYFREGRASVRLWAFGLAIGPEISYRADVGPGRPDLDELAGGASIAFGLLEEETQVLLQASWLPLGGQTDFVEAGLEVGLFRYGLIALSVRRLVPRKGATGSLAVLSVGGRLPW